MTRDESYAMLRVPPEVRSALEPIARQQNRSWSQQARHILERYVVQNQLKQTTTQS
jgi:hypothetical protein